MSQPLGSSNNEELVRSDEEKDKKQAAYAYASGADQMTIEEREELREMISQARPGGPERVLNEQRLPIESIGEPEGDPAAGEEPGANEDAGVKSVSSGEYAGRRGERPEQ